MAILDPLKTVKAKVSTNILGSIGGGVAGVMLVKKYSPRKGWLAMTLGVIGGAISGAYVQSKIVAKKGEVSSSKEAKK